MNVKIKRAKKLGVRLAILRFSFARPDAYETFENRKIAGTPIGSFSAIQ
jgi:hypothetical protein